MHLLSREIVRARVGSVSIPRTLHEFHALESYVNLDHRNDQFWVQLPELLHFSASAPFVVQLDGFSQLKVTFLCIAQSVQVLGVPFVGQGSILRQAASSGVNHRCLVVLACSIPVSLQRFELPLEERVKVYDVGILFATTQHIVLDSVHHNIDKDDNRFHVPKPRPNFSPWKQASLQGSSTSCRWFRESVTPWTSNLLHRRDTRR